MALDISLFPQCQRFWGVPRVKRPLAAQRLFEGISEYKKQFVNCNSSDIYENDKALNLNDIIEMMAASEAAAHLSPHRRNGAGRLRLAREFGLAQEWLGRDVA